MMVEANLVIIGATVQWINRMSLNTRLSRLKLLMNAIENVTIRMSLISGSSLEAFWLDHILPCFENGFQESRTCVSFFINARAWLWLERLSIFIQAYFMKIVQNLPFQCPLC